MSRIYGDGLYLGNKDDAFSRDFMMEYPTAVLNVAYEIPKTDFAIDYMNIPLRNDDTCRILEFFNDAIEFIEKHLKMNNRVLVHCMGGISRSASFIIAYMMYKKSMRMMDAIDYVKSKRPCIDPNFNFLGQLYSYEYKLFKR